jgi:hypothetical protein
MAHISNQFRKIDQGQYRGFRWFLMLPVRDGRLLPVVYLLDVSRTGWVQSFGSLRGVRAWVDGHRAVTPVQ